MTPSDNKSRLKSLGLRTDLIFHRLSADIFDRGEYMVIRTPDRPRYFWGNFLIMNRKPAPGDLNEWIALFEKEIAGRDERGFIAIAWDVVDDAPGDIQQFVDYGFEVEKLVVLSATKVRKPPKYNPDLVVRPLESESDWERYLDIQYNPEWKYGDDESQRRFIQSERDAIRALTDAGHGIRYGAELDGELVGDLGIYWDGDVARFNNVVTHRDFRRRGVCGTLVYEASRRAFEEHGLKTLVMVADDDYHAARIYESVGFDPSERFFTLTWYDPDWKE